MIFIDGVGELEEPDGEADAVGHEEGHAEIGEVDAGGADVAREVAEERVGEEGAEIPGERDRGDLVAVVLLHADEEVEEKDDGGGDPEASAAEEVGEEMAFLGRFDERLFEPQQRKREALVAAPLGEHDEAEADHHEPAEEQERAPGDERPFPRGPRDALALGEFADEVLGGGDFGLVAEPGGKETRGELCLLVRLGEVGVVADGDGDVGDGVWQHAEQAAGGDDTGDEEDAEDES